MSSGRPSHVGRFDRSAKADPPPQPLTEPRAGANAAPVLDTAINNSRMSTTPRRGRRYSTTTKRATRSLSMWQIVPRSQAAWSLSCRQWSLLCCAITRACECRATCLLPEIHLAQCAAQGQRVASMLIVISWHDVPPYRVRLMCRVSVNNELGYVDGGQARSELLCESESLLRVLDRRRRRACVRWRVYGDLSTAVRTHRGRGPRVISM